MEDDEGSDEFSLRMAPEVYSAIGELVVAFQSLEMNITDLAIMLTPCPRRIGEILTAQLSFKQRCHLVTALYTELLGPGQRQVLLDAAVARAYKCEEDRNRFVHSVWLAGYRHKTTARGQIKFQVEEHANDEKLCEAVRKCEEASHAIGEIYSELGMMGLRGAALLKGYSPGRHDKPQ